MGTAPAAGPRHRLTVEGPGDHWPGAGPQTVTAVVRVGAGAAEQAPPPDELGVIIAVDFAPGRVEETREAVAAAVRALPEGASFAVLGGDSVTAHPDTGGWAVADEARRKQAVFVATRLLPLTAAARGGCLTWLERARTMAREHPRRIVRLVMITDGAGTGVDGLDAELDACEGRFTCDVLGVGADWEAEVLARIARRLHGTAAPVSGRVAEAVAAVVGRLGALRDPELPVWVTPRRGVRLLSLEETFPSRRPLTPYPAGPGEAGEPAGQPPGTGPAPGRLLFRTYAWATEERHYLLTLSAQAGSDLHHEEIQLAMVSVPGADAAVLVRWTAAVRADPAPARSPVPYGGEESRHVQYSRMVEEFKRGLDALAAGREGSADRHLKNASGLAGRLGDRSRLAHIRDAQLQLRAGAATGDGEAARPVPLTHLLLSALTGPGTPPPAGPTSGPAAPCVRPGCGRPVRAAATFCVYCGTEQGGPA
ncbi:hypothetical protein ACIQM4_24175 [Streptomyces sp. NPDC091272]|uniref:hypothetical protein n=1 Tax=Streptomyces sp. NPDC091272 TaxID=3365981 RepID=UPI0038116FC0